MRIIGGKHKGKILSTFDGDKIRPTSDRAREALFNILQFKIANCSFCDAFCGSGAVGIEAISRGAKEVFFTDSSIDSILLTKKNLLSIKENAVVENVDALTFLKRTSNFFDVIFLDPPYKFEKVDELLEIIAKKSLLKSDGVIVYEHNAIDLQKRFVVEKLELFSTKKYGIAEFDFYRWKQ